MGVLEFESKFAVLETAVLTRLHYTPNYPLKLRGLFADDDMDVRLRHATYPHVGVCSSSSSSLLFVVFSLRWRLLDFRSFDLECFDDDRWPVRTSPHSCRPPQRPRHYTSGTLIHIQYSDPLCRLG